MRTTLRLLTSAGFAIAAGTALVFALDMLSAGLSATDTTKGAILCGIGGLNVLGATICSCAFFGSLGRSFLDRGLTSEEGCRTLIASTRWTLLGTAPGPGQDSHRIRGS